MKKLKLTVAEPCHENWNDMTPDQKGRFCAACQKTVVDFTYMGDRQIAEYFKKPAGSVCGRFYKDQLNREMAVKEKRSSLPGHFFRYSWPALLLLLKSCDDKKGIMGDIDIVATKETDVFTTMGFAFPEITPVDSASGVFQEPEPIDCTSIVGQTSVIIKGDTTIVCRKETVEDVFTDADSAFVVVDSAGVLIDSLSVVEASPMEEILMGAIAVTHVIEENKQQETSAGKYSIDKPEAAPVLIYPNPITKGQLLKIFFNEPFNGIYQVYAASGQVLQTGKVAAGKDHRFTVPIQSWSAGSYFISISDEKSKRVMTKKFIVQ